MNTTTTTTTPARTTGTAPVAPPALPQLPADLEAGLRRLKLSRIRALAPELLATAKVQRWAPEEVLRTLVEAELTARDASNAANRLKAAGLCADIATVLMPLSWLPAH